MGSRVVSIFLVCSEHRPSIHIGPRLPRASGHTLPAMDAKQHDVETYENVDKLGAAGPAETTDQRPGYIASNEEERRLDRSLNLKMDFTVVLLLTLGFMVSVSPKLPPPSANRHQPSLSYTSSCSCTPGQST